MEDIEAIIYIIMDDFIYCFVNVSLHKNQVNIIGHEQLVIFPELRAVSR